MNLFATNKSPVVSAWALDDKRVGKMLMEANQMLSSAVIRHWLEKDPYWEPPEQLSRPSHAHHPITLWVARTRGNFKWCLEHAKELDNEFEKRFGKRHASGLRTAYIDKMGYIDVLPDLPLEPFVNCARNKSLGIDFAHLDDVHEAYKAYLLKRWRTAVEPPKWTNASPPTWAERHL